MTPFPASHSLFRATRGVLMGAALAGLGAVASCTYQHGDPAPVDISGETITYAKVVSPLFDLHCRQCHGTSVATTLGGSNDFGTYQAIRAYPAPALLGSIEHTFGYDPMPKGRAKMPESDIQRIKAWLAAGALDN